MSNGKIRNPLFFTEKGKYQKNPIFNIENNINGVTRFAISKLTDNGKWHRGSNTIYYNLNGVNIYTDDNNIIFIDTESNTAWIKEYDKVVNQINPTTPEEKQYILLYTDLEYESESTEFPMRWEAVTGRMSAYENIKINAPIIDIDKSLILTETVPLKDSLTVRQFVDYLKNSDIIDDESFDINDYSGSDYI